MRPDEEFVVATVKFLVRKNDRVSLKEIRNDVADQLHEILGKTLIIPVFNITELEDVGGSLHQQKDGEYIEI